MGQAAPVWQQLIIRANRVLDLAEQEFIQTVRTRPATTPDLSLLVSKRIPAQNTIAIAGVPVVIDVLITRHLAPSRSRILSDVEWLTDKFNLDLFLWLGTHRGKERFLGMMITNALKQMVEKIAEKTDKAKISTKARVTELIMSDCACTGCIYEKGGANFKESGHAIFDSGGFGADFTNNSLGDTKDLEIKVKHDPDANTVSIIDCGIGLLKAEAPVYRAMHPRASRDTIDSLNPYINVLTTCVSTAPVDEPTAMSFTIPLTGSTIVNTTAVVRRALRQQTALILRLRLAAGVFALRCRVVVEVLPRGVPPPGIDGVSASVLHPTWKWITPSTSYACLPSVTHWRWTCAHSSSAM